MKNQILDFLLKITHQPHQNTHQQSKTQSTYNALVHESLYLYLDSN